MNRFVSVLKTISVSISFSFFGCETGGSEIGAFRARPDAGHAAPDAATDFSAADAAPAADISPPVPATAQVSYDFGTWNLRGYEEASLCIAWTLRNDAPLYLQRFRMRNGGSVHHANWYVVPDHLFDGPDGFFTCETRDFSELNAVLTGTAIYAQSTQAQFEVQELGPGIAVKIPAHHRIIASVHLLNLSARPGRTFVQSTLDLLHPRDVATVAAPFRLFYNDLHIPPQRDSRFETECDLVAAAADPNFNLKLFYVLPHYHQLGNGFRLSLLGGPDDGRSLYESVAFDAEANGRAFDPPAELGPGGARGFRFSCDYRNPTSREIRFGLADGEMCMMLGFADSPLLFNAGVPRGDTRLGERDGVEVHGAPCEVTPLPRRNTQDMPTAEEIAGELYVPEGAANLDRPVEAPDCNDTPTDATTDEPVTLARVRDEVFRPTCAFSACHGGDAPAAGLRLDGDLDVLRRDLLRHDPQADTVLKLVVPGDPLGSWLYHLVSRCEPQDDTGRVVRHMPLNAPELLDPSLVALLREWIARGAERDP